MSDVSRFYGAPDFKETRIVRVRVGILLSAFPSYSGAEQGKKSLRIASRGEVLGVAPPPLISDGFPANGIAEEACMIRKLGRDCMESRREFLKQ